MQAQRCPLLRRWGQWKPLWVKYAKVVKIAGDSCPLIWYMIVYRTDTAGFFHDNTGMSKLVPYKAATLVTVAVANIVASPMHQSTSGKAMSPRLERPLGLDRSNAHSLAPENIDGGVGRIVGPLREGSNESSHFHDVRQP